VYLLCASLVFLPYSWIVIEFFWVSLAWDGMRWNDAGTDVGFDVTLQKAFGHCYRILSGPSLRHNTYLLAVRKKTRPVDYMIIIIESRHVTVTTSTRDNYQYLPLPAVRVTHDMYFPQDIACLGIDPTMLLIASTEGNGQRSSQDCSLV
jgi:hypothetical protein